MSQDSQVICNILRVVIINLNSALILSSHKNLSLEVTLAFN